MKRLLTVASAALILGLGIGSIVTNAIAQNTTQTAVTIQETAKPPTSTELLALVNAERAKHGVASLKEDPRLDASAQMKANDEVAFNYFDHVSPDGSPYAGIHGYKLIDKTGLSCMYGAENLSEAHGISTSRGATDGWISSPEHHATMLDARYTLTGFGIAGNQVVEHFCQPKL